MTTQSKLTEYLNSQTPLFSSGFSRFDITDENYEDGGLITLGFDRITQYDHPFYPWVIEVARKVTKDKTISSVSRSLTLTSNQWIDFMKEAGLFCPFDKIQTTRKSDKKSGRKNRYNDSGIEEIDYRTVHTLVDDVFDEKYYLTDGITKSQILDLKNRLAQIWENSPFHLWELNSIGKNSDLFFKVQDAIYKWAIDHDLLGDGSKIQQY